MLTTVRSWLEVQPLFTVVVRNKHLYGDTIFLPVYFIGELSHTVSTNEWENSVSSFVFHLVLDYTTETRLPSCHSGYFVVFYFLLWSHIHLPFPHAVVGSGCHGISWSHWAWTTRPTSCAWWRVARPASGNLSRWPTTAPWCTRVACVETMDSSAPITSRTDQDKLLQEPGGKSLAIAAAINSSPQCLKQKKNLQTSPTCLYCVPCYDLWVDWRRLNVVMRDWVHLTC